MASSTSFPTRRQFGALATAVLSAAVDTGGAVAQEAVRGGTLHINFKADNTAFVSLDPFQVYWIEHRVVLRNVVESLTDQDPKTGAILPWLAKSWNVSEDGLAYTFVLRQGVTFSNGTPFNAEAVRTAFDANKALAAKVPGRFGAAYLTGYDHADVVDDHTVRIVLTQPNAAFLQATSTTNLGILAPESYRIRHEERSRGAIIGTGPFVLVKYTPEVGIDLVRRQGYAWPSAAARNAGESYLDAVSVRYVPEDNIRNGQFLQGQVELLWPREPFSEADLQVFVRRNAQIFSRALPGPAFNLYPNVSEGRILNDPRVRLALQKSIDRKTYAQAVFNQGFPVVQGAFDTTTPYFISEASKLGHDPEAAANLLDEAGWKPAADGWRYKDGKRLTLVQPLQRETSGDVLLQDQFRAIGIEYKLQILVAGEYLAALAAGKWDLFASYMTRADPAVLQTFLDPRFTNNSALSVNVYSPQTLQRAKALFDAGLQAGSTEARADAYAALQNLLIDDNVAFPLYERLWQVAALPRVRGFQWSSEGFALLNDIWLART